MLYIFSVLPSPEAVVEFSYLGIMTLTNTILTQYLTKNSFSGGLILEQNFPQSLQFLNILY